MHSGVCNQWFLDNPSLNVQPKTQTKTGLHANIIITVTYCAPPSIMYTVFRL